jgi:hypothetical protein
VCGEHAGLFVNRLYRFSTQQMVYRRRKKGGAAVGQKCDAYQNCADRTQHDHLKLVAQAKFGNQSTIARRAFLAQIPKESATLTDQHHQTSAGMQVVLMHFEMLGKLINPVSEY